jgi:uncharacterized protein
VSGPLPLDRPFGDALVALARAAVAAHLSAGPDPALPAEGPLAAPAGAFVTLEVGGEVRGCLGSFAPQGSLAATVVRLAQRAVAGDPRFAPLRLDELAALRLRVAVVSPRRPMRAPAEIALGVDGLLVRCGWHAGALLPRVATEQGWDRQTFLARACLAAGLPPRAWTRPGAAVELFATVELAEGPASG